MLVKCVSPKPGAVALWEEKGSEPTTLPQTPRFDPAGMVHKVVPTGSHLSYQMKKASRLRGRHPPPSWNTAGGGDHAGASLI